MLVDTTTCQANTAAVGTYRMRVKFDCGKFMQSTVIALILWKNAFMTYFALFIEAILMALKFILVVVCT